MTSRPTNTAAVQIAGGSGIGYVFYHQYPQSEWYQPTSSRVQIQRVIASIETTRSSVNITDENGNYYCRTLVKDKYMPTETEAPAGYTIKSADYRSQC